MDASTTSATATATLLPTPYLISNDCPAVWPETASLNVVASYPFLNPPSEETPSDFVVRAYLESLWLPEVYFIIWNFPVYDVYYVLMNALPVIKDHCPT